MSLIAGALSNRFGIQVGQKNVAVAGTAEQVGGATPLPDGFKLTIKAKAANTGTIRLAGNQADAQNAAVAFKLGANEAVSVGVKYLNEVWIDTTVNGEGIEWLVEA